MEKYINPFTDYGFKIIFGRAFNKMLLIDFVNQVLRGRDKVKDLRYLNNEALGNTSADRTAIFDLYCENEKGEKFIIELQNIKQRFFLDRSIFYSTFPIQNQAPKGKDWNYHLKAVYTIGVLNFELAGRTNSDRYMRDVMLMDKHTHEIFYDKLTFMYLEMPKFKKREDELETHFDKWLYVLKHLSNFQKRPKELQGKIFDKLFEVAEIAKLTPEDMRKYEESLKIYRDNRNTMEYALQEATQKGMEKGIRKGMEKGIQKGIEKGKEVERIEIAKMLKKNGVPIEVIAKSTGLVQEQIEQLDL